MGKSSLRLVEGSSNGGDEVGTDMGKGGGIPDDGASDLVWDSVKGCGNGREWEWWRRYMGLVVKIIGRAVIDGGVDIARSSWPTSASDHTGVGTGAGIEILVVTHSAGVMVVWPQNSSVLRRLLFSSADGALNQ
ncbi:hypothetical protein Tco_0517588 [Tanacetum coccineum]